MPNKLKIVTANYQLAGFQPAAFSDFDFRHIYFRYKATSGDVVLYTIELPDPENMGVAVGILSLCALEPEIRWG